MLSAWITDEPDEVVKAEHTHPMDVQADLMIRAGYLATRRIASYFGLRGEADPQPTDPTSVDRAHFDEALEVLADAGVPIVDDRDQAWRDFSGWRVNYDASLRHLERLTMAPTPWWERPMLSAWITDEPDEVVKAEHMHPIDGESVSIGRVARPD